ncbi:MAG: hypothetical protein LBI65_03380, partial [Candidatus Symbiothrix sp.]|jgi:hypothetical protein|nr:hypothetical protein [Candidatus Symbiothrix sp.]
VTLSAAGVSSAIKAGQTGKVTINSSTAAVLTGQLGANINANAIYVLRLGDDSDPAANSWSFGTNIPGQNDPATHTGSAKRAFRDCDWSDQEIKVAKFLANDDVFTIQEYGSVDIDLTANDIIPGDANIDIQNGVNGGILSQPAAGDLTFPSKNTVRYSHKANAALPEGIESFQYKIAYTQAGVLTEREARVYIFVLQSESGAFSGCYGESYSVKLKESSAGIRFYWAAGPSAPEETAPKSELLLTGLTADTLFYIHPVLAVTPYNSIAFPRGRLRVSVVPEAVNGKMAVLKWSAAAGTGDWFNPNNWTDNTGNAVTYAPTSCTDIVLPEGKTVYPSLSRAGKVHHIDLKNRAMLGNVFRLAYHAVRIELKPAASERNRMLMYSAPLAKTFSGDFMLRGKDGYPLKKAVYMSFFQETNPDNSSETAEALHFTPSFSKEDVELVLGRGFILYVDGTRDPANTAFCFPSPADQYEYYYDDEYTFASLTDMAASPNPPPPFSGVLDRGTPEKNGRFITEMAPATYAASGSFEFTPPNDRAGSKLLMLVNPFSACLDVEKLLAGNSGTLTPDRYCIWNGTEVADFISFRKSQNQWVAGNPDLLPQSPSKWIPPYRAFFVLKKDPASTVSITVSEAWTTTEAAAYAPEGDY